MEYQILKIKLLQIIECIDHYTSEASINVLLRNGKEALEKDNICIIKYTIEELTKWYDKNIGHILCNQYVYNKNVHKDNIEILKELTKCVENDNFDVPRSINNSNAQVGENKLDDLIRIITRFHLIVRQLRYRYNSRETIDVSDEYDVQDLLHSLLYLYFDDVRKEEWTPSYAGKCSRQDFLLKNEDIVIEVKKTRPGLAEKELSDQLIVDIARYRSHPNCKTLVCFVYDPEERIKNPIGIENDLTDDNKELKVIVKIIQK